MKSFKEYYRILTLDPWWANTDSLCTIRALVSLMLSFTAMIMLILNVINHSYAMIVTSTIIAVGFLLSAYFAGIKKEPIVAAYIMAGLVCLVFSYFAISGGNQGFAILWVLLVPMFAINLLGIKIGVALSLYFLVFLLLLFYTPLNDFIQGKYTGSFISKFPILYISDCFVSLMISFQKEFYNRKVHLQSNMDEMTGAFNRRYFTNHVIKAPIKQGQDICVVVIDIDGLKPINDSLGHEAGDELICAVPACCKKVLKSGFVLCRIGGDEFVLVLNEKDDAARELLDKMRKAGENWLGKYSKGCSFSFGCASSDIYPDANMNDLFVKADLEMYGYKTRRKANRQ